MPQVYEDALVTVEALGPLGSLGNNSYIVRPQDGGAVLVIDAPEGSEAVLEALGDLAVVGILITHQPVNRAKGQDGFCPLGPAIATGLDAATLVVRTTLNGDLRQDFPISDMRFTVAQLVSLISNDMTLQPGDAILCGTSLGVGSMKPGSDVSVEIEGIGTLRNRYVARDR